MTTTEATLAVIGAVLVFWIVGAYNRMVRLRNDLVARFAAVDERYRQRHVLLQSQIDLLASALRPATVNATAREPGVRRNHWRSRQWSSRVAARRPAR